MSQELLGLVSLGLLFVVIFVGFPIAFTLGAMALLTGWYAFGPMVLYLAVLITATIFAAATGIVGSSVTLLGVMAGPAMIKSGYDPKMSAGAITAGGTLGILIPPSVMLIVMGPVVGLPATDLFAAAVLPGLLLSTIFTVWCLVRCWINPALGPALPPE